MSTNLDKIGERIVNIIKLSEAIIGENYQIIKCKDFKLITSFPTNSKPPLQEEDHIQVQGKNNQIVNFVNISFGAEMEMNFKDAEDVEIAAIEYYTEPKVNWRYK